MTLVAEEYQNCRRGQPWFTTICCTEKADVAIKLEMPESGDFFHSKMQATTQNVGVLTKRREHTGWIMLVGSEGVTGASYEVECT